MEKKVKYYKKNKKEAMYYLPWYSFFLPYSDKAVLSITDIQTIAISLGLASFFEYGFYVTKGGFMFYNTGTIFGHS